jgi:hypothetical protein
MRGGNGHHRIRQVSLLIEGIAEEAANHAELSVTAACCVCINISTSREIKKTYRKRPFLALYRLLPMLYRNRNVMVLAAIEVSCSGGPSECRRLLPCRRFEHFIVHDRLLHFHRVRCFEQFDKCQMRSSVQQLNGAGQ